MRSRNRLPLVALSLAALGLALLPAGPGASPSLADHGRLGGSPAGEQPRQTSDGEPGEIAAPVPARAAAPRQVGRERSRWLAPGVHFRRFDTTDRRGRYRTHVLTVDPDRRGVRLDYSSPATVPSRGRLTRLLGQDARAVAGINGGFFDIHDTGAPLGVGQDRQRGFLHAAKYTWSNAFTLTTEGRPRIGHVPLRAEVAEHPDIEVTNVNSPRVREGKVGLYTPAWGTTSGYSVTDGQERRVRAVVVEDGVVVDSSPRLTDGVPITGSLLVGRGPGAARLAELPIGAPVTTSATIPARYRVALSGESVLLRGGRVRVSDDVYLHPRTAVGIDRDTGRVLLVAVDGRRESSRGLTLVELARLMRRLGADSALNLDGGGSTTMAGLDRTRTDLRVLNRPSDGRQRRIADGIVVLAR